jgi:hypothetical protein
MVISIGPLSILSSFLGIFTINLPFNISAVISAPFAV